MKTYKYKVDKDQKWLLSKGWGIPIGLHPDSEEELERRRAFKPLSIELQEKRRQHMQELHEEGASYALIGKLYQLDRSLVRKIIINS